MYVQETENIPVTLTASNVTGTATISWEERDGFDVLG
jgi:hypothetical protein